MIRIFAILMVVVIHSNVAFLLKNQGSAAWIFVMEVTALCLVAVPLFFMISGALLLDCNSVISIYNLFHKRLPKQAIPFVFWSLIYVIARIAMGKLPLSIRSFIQLLYEPAYYQFWFMYALLAMYLLLPALQAVVLHLNQKQTEYILIIWLIFSVIIPGAEYFVPGFKISSHVDLILCEGYVGYFLLGYYLKKYRKNCGTRKALFVAVTGIIVTGAAAWGEWFHSVMTGTAFSGYIYQAYLLPGVVIAATGVFLLFQNIKYQGSKSRIVAETSKLSIGVFYIHMLVLTAVEYAGITGSDSVIILAVKIIIVYLISTVCAFFVSKVPYLKGLLMGLPERKTK